MAKPIELTSENFNEYLNATELPVLVDFWAPWCNPCRMIAPFVEELADDFNGRLLVGKVNIDEYAELAASHQVTTIPTFIIFKDGKKLDRIVGANPQGLVSIIERACE